MASVGAKFCFLNGISTKRFRDFLLDFTAPYGSADFLRLPDLSTFNLPAFAKTLRESPSKIEQLKVDPFVLPYSYADDRPVTQRSTLRTQLFYCEECARQGYHSLFHQIESIKRCLLHGVELVCYSGRKRGNRFQRQDDRMIADTYELLFGTASNWNFKEYQGWQPNNKKEDWVVVSKYLSLAEWARRKSISNGKLVILQGNGRNNQEAALRSLLWPETIEPEIGDCLANFGAAESITKCLFSGASGGTSITASKLRQVAFLSELAGAWRNWALLLGVPTIWQQTAQDCFEQLLVQHEDCWAWFDRQAISAPRFGEMRGEEKYWQACPRVVAAKKIQQYWLRPLHLCQIKRAYELCGNDSQFFEALGRQLEILGLAKSERVWTLCPDPGDLVRPYSITAWRISEELQRLFDQILLCDLMNELWWYWEREYVCPDAAPWNGFYSSSYYLLEAPDGTVELHSCGRDPGLPNWDASKAGGACLAATAGKKIR